MHCFNLVDLSTCNNCLVTFERSYDVSNPSCSANCSLYSFRNNLVLIDILASHLHPAILYHLQLLYEIFFFFFFHHKWLFLSLIKIVGFIQFNHASPSFSGQDKYPHVCSSFFCVMFFILHRSFFDIPSYFCFSW